MPTMVVAHPLPGFSGRVAVEEFGLVFVGGFTGPLDVPAHIQTRLAAAGFTLNATPGANYGGKYVLDSDLLDPNSEVSATLRAASERAVLLGRGALPSVVPNPAELDVTLADALYGYPGWMNAAGALVYAFGSTTLQQSGDGGVTWTNVQTFGAPIHGVRDLDDGELLVSLQAAGSPGVVWKSTGYDPATGTADSWAIVVTASSDGTWIDGGWGMSVHRNIVVLSEYGETMPPNNARRAWLSTDYGATFEVIYTMDPALIGHIHGVCYDPYDGRIWLTRGDYSVGNPTVQQRAIEYSDDLGQTWHVLSLDFQPTGIITLPNCVLMVSDSAPNGVYRIPRTRLKTSIPTVEVAHLLDDEDDLTFVGNQVFQARRDDAPVLMPFAWGAATGAGPGVLLATVDGYNFFELWRDDLEYGYTWGLLTAVGPTADGKILGTLRDGRNVSGSYSLFTADAPEWVGLTA